MRMYLTLWKFQRAFCFFMLMLPPIKGSCNNGFRGTECQYMCHCQDADGGCQADGSCKRGCAEGFMGSKCQHTVMGSWMANDFQIKGSSVLCNHNMQKITLTISEPQPFLWMSVWTKDNFVNTHNISAGDTEGSAPSDIHVAVNGDVTPCSRPVLIPPSNNVVTLMCENVQEPVRLLEFKGEMIKDWCQIKVSGGRNFALNQEVEHLTIDPDNQGEAASVDGELDYMSCSFAVRKDNSSVLWKLTLRNRIDVYKIKVRSVSDIVDNPMSDLQVEVFSGSKSLFKNRSAKDNTDTDLVFSVPVLRGVTEIIVDKPEELNICEFELYGECAPGLFGDCIPNVECMCANEWDHCSPDIGSCPSGCGAGYMGDNCTIACTNGTYGRMCRESCYSACQDGQCNTMNGSCLFGCAETTFIPPMCQERPSTYQKIGTVAETNSNALMIVIPIVLIVGLLLAAVVTLLPGKKRKKEVEKERQQENEVEASIFEERAVSEILVPRQEEAIDFDDAEASSVDVLEESDSPPS